MSVFNGLTSVLPDASASANNFETEKSPNAGTKPAAAAASQPAQPMQPLPAAIPVTRPGSQVELPTTQMRESSRVLRDMLALGQSRSETLGNSHDAEALQDVIPREAMRCLLAALHARDVTTVQHSRRVAMLAVGMGRRLGWDEEQLRLLEVAALLHDIGKVGVPDHILFKPGKLSADEAELMALHQDVGVDVLQACAVDEEVLEIITHSHHHFNGASCGFERIGSEVHQGARILAVADAYDSLATAQVYRAAKSHKEIMKILVDSAGSQFDGNVVCALARWTEEQNLPWHDLTEQAPAPAAPKAQPSEPAFSQHSLFGIFSYLHVLESLYDGFYLLDSDLRFVVWNRGTSRLLGQRSKSMIGRTWTSGLIKHGKADGSPMPDSECPVNQVIRTGRVMTSSLKLKNQSEQWIDVETQTVPLFDDEGNLCGVAEIFRDLSRTSRRPQEYHELKLAASRDALTSVANRGELETQLTVLINQWSTAEEPEPFSVIFLDIDFFKSVNDTYGHAAGDQVLVETAQLLQHETYSGELVGRYGGEEFVVICPGTNLKQAEEKAERLRRVLGRATFSGLGDLTITGSFGVTEMEHGDSVSSLVRRADQGLYISKNRGRNRTTTLTSEESLNGAKAEETDKDKDSANPFELTATLHVAGSSDMIICKLGGFVDDQQAVLSPVSKNKILMRIGKKSLFGGWGKTRDRQPVEVVIEMEDAERRRGPRAGQRLALQTSIYPVGRVKQVAVFQQRAKLVLKQLRGHLVAE